MAGLIDTTLDLRAASRMDPDRDNTLRRYLLQTVEGPFDRAYGYIAVHY